MASVRGSGLSPGRFGTPRAGGGVTVIGTDALIARFRGVASLCALETGHIAFATAMAIEARAKQLAPKESGNLASGIHARKLAPYTWSVEASTLQGNIEPENTREYAAYVEYGTRKMSARPFLRPAFAQSIGIANLQLQALARRLRSMF